MTTELALSLGDSIDPPNFDPELLLPLMGPAIGTSLIDGIPWTFGFDFSTFDGEQVPELEGRTPPLELGPGVTPVGFESTGALSVSAIGAARIDRAVSFSPIVPLKMQTSVGGNDVFATPEGTSVWYRGIYIDTGPEIGGFGSIIDRQTNPLGPPNLQRVNWARSDGRARYTRFVDGNPSHADGPTTGDGGPQLVDIYLRGPNGEVTVCSGGQCQTTPGPGPVEPISNGVIRCGGNLEGGLLFAGAMIGPLADALFSPQIHAAAYAGSGLST